MITLFGPYLTSKIRRKLVNIHFERSMFSSRPLNSYMRYGCLARAAIISRTVTCRPYQRLQLRTMSSSPTAPPAKRLKPSSIDDASSAVSLSVEQAPVEALFVPEQAPASTDAGPSAPKAVTQAKPAKESRKKRRQRFNLPEPYSPADVLSKDVADFLGEEYVQEVVNKGEKGQEAWSAPEDLVPQSIVSLRVGAFTVSGQYLAHLARESCLDASRRVAFGLAARGPAQMGYPCSVRASG